MDIFDKATRSKVMSKIRSKDTKIELKVRRELWKLGYKGYRKHAKINGSPDIAFTRKKLAIFIDGDFWHGWVLKERESSLPPFWVEKIKKNIARDKRDHGSLKSRGWKVIRLWEHEIEEDFGRSIKRLIKFLSS